MSKTYKLQTERKFTLLQAALGKTQLNIVIIAPGSLYGNAMALGQS